MSRKRRNHSTAFKARVALAAVKGDRTLSELAEQFQLHPNQITNWTSPNWTPTISCSSAAVGAEGRQAVTTQLFLFLPIELSGSTSA